MLLLFMGAGPSNVCHALADSFVFRYDATIQRIEPAKTSRRSMLYTVLYDDGEVGEHLSIDDLRVPIRSDRTAPDHLISNDASLGAS